MSNLTAAGILDLIADTDEAAVSGNDCEEIKISQALSNVSYDASNGIITGTITYGVFRQDLNDTYCGTSLPFSEDQSFMIMGVDCTLPQPVFASTAFTFPSCNDDGDLEGFVTAQLDGQDEGLYTWTWTPSGGTAIAGETSEALPASKVEQGVEYTVTASNACLLYTSDAADD